MHVCNVYADPSKVFDDMLDIKEIVDCAEDISKYYDDLTFIHEFFTDDFCRKQEYFHWKHYPNGEIRLESKDYKKIKNIIMRRHINGGLPDIKLMEPNYAGRGIMMLQHDGDGRGLYEPYVSDVLASLRAIWGKDVVLATMDEKTAQEKIYYCHVSSVDKIDRKKLHDLY
jgi:stage V sporulation protein R